MFAPSAPMTKDTQIDRELDMALASGPLRDMVIPPCPELLVALRKEMRQADPEPLVIADIAGRDVAMAASLIRAANSPIYQVVRLFSVGQCIQTERANTRDGGVGFRLCSKRPDTNAETWPTRHVQGIAQHGESCAIQL